MIDRALKTERIFGREIRVRDVIPVWFMPGGALVLAERPYTGTLAYLWPEGARIVRFTSATPRGWTEMTVPNGDLFARVVIEGGSNA